MNDASITDVRALAFVVDFLEKFDPGKTREPLRWGAFQVPDSSWTAFSALQSVKRVVNPYLCLHNF